MTTLLSTSLALPTVANSYFSDIEDIGWNGIENVINQVAELGLVNGYTDGTFRAYNPVTYAEAIHMVYTLLTQTGMAMEFSLNDQARYQSILLEYNVPIWAQKATAYALEYKLLNLYELEKFSNEEGDCFATREDVAQMFGKSLTKYYLLDMNPVNVQKFHDYTTISDDAIRFVDLCSRLGIINGDTNGYFNPKQLINRAEMAVLLNKTYQTLQDGVTQLATISEIVASGSGFDMTVTFEDGTKDAFFIRDDFVEIVGMIDGAERSMSIAQLEIGNEIELLQKAGRIKTVCVLEATETQFTYDIKGYVSQANRNTMMIEAILNGDEDAYSITDDIEIFVHGELTAYEDFVQEFNGTPYPYVFVGMYVHGSDDYQTDLNGNRILQTSDKILRIDIEFTDSYTKYGRVDLLNDSNLRMLTLDYISSELHSYSTSTKVYLNGQKSIMEEIKALFQTSTLYVTATIGKYGNIEEAFFTTDPPITIVPQEFELYTLENISTRYMTVKRDGKTTNYSFGVSGHDTDDIDFYWWDNGWESESISQMIRLYDNHKDSSTSNLYMNMGFDSNGMLAKIEVATNQIAWNLDSSSNSNLDRKGILDYYDGNILKFENSNIEYTLLPYYNVVTTNENVNVIIEDDPNGTGNRVRNPLTIEGAKTHSLVVFKRMAQSDDVEMSLEVIANQDNVIQKIEASLISVEGYFNYLDMEEYTISVRLENNDVLNMAVKMKPTIENSGISIESLQSTTYRDMPIYIEFNNNGEVDYIHIMDGAGNISGTKVAGIMTGDSNNIFFDGSNVKYQWASNSEFYLKSYSIPAESITMYSLQKLASDTDVEMYVKADVWTDNRRIHTMEVYLEHLEGEFQNYNDANRTVRIKTSAGNNVTVKIDFLETEIDILGLSKDELNKKAVGTPVTVTFGDDGIATAVFH